jgi:hypothetical protein
MMWGKLSGLDGGKQYNGGNIGHPEHIQEEEGNQVSCPENGRHDLRDGGF